MELLLALAALYALQCLRLLPAGSVAYGGVLRRPHVATGPGWRALSLLPGAATFLGARLPVYERHGELCAIARVSRLGLAPSPGAGEPLPARAAVDVRGRLVRVNGRPFARGLTPRHAADLAALIEGLADASTEEARRRLASALDAGFDLERFTAERARFESGTRALAWLLSGYFVALFALLPAMLLLLHVERGLLLWLPIGVSLHAAAWGALLVAQRRLAPAGVADRAELLLSAALYPPALLRGLQELWDRTCAVGQPAVLACVLLVGDERRARLRAELARLEGARERETPGRLGVTDLEHRALLRMLEAAGEDVDRLRAPRPARDPVAASYCPVCLSDYRDDVTHCGDCDVRLVAYARAEAAEADSARGAP